jgi:16S rRNA (cytosine1402-N4)-methyltransferase
MAHIPVLLHEAIEGMNLQATDVVVDATLGSAGHARAIADVLSEHGRLIGIDADRDALDRSRTMLENVKPHVDLVESNYRMLTSVLDTLGIARIDKALFDLGLSSVQLDESDRGFSFRREFPLLMTLQTQPGSDEVTAHDVVNTWSEETLADIIFGFGEETFARRIAKAIVAERERAPIETTFALRDLVAEAIPRRFHRRGLHPATKTFQAIRIAVNDELGAIEEGLTAAWERLNPHGRIAVITFHSLEDRIVKRLFREQVRQHAGRLPAKRPITPSDEELRANPRARSAKLRIIEKT